MKKNYIKPSVEINEMQLENMIAMSMQVSAKEADEGDWADARDRGGIDLDNSFLDSWFD